MKIEYNNLFHILIILSFVHQCEIDGINLDHKLSKIKGVGKTQEINEIIPCFAGPVTRNLLAARRINRFEARMENKHGYVFFAELALRVRT